VYHKVLAPAEDVKVVVPPTLIVDEPETEAVGAEGAAPATVTATASDAEQPFVPVTVNVYVVVVVAEQFGFNTLVADNAVAGDQE
jgi:hypothetical protein